MSLGKIKSHLLSIFAISIVSHLVSIFAISIVSHLVSIFESKFSVYKQPTNQPCRHHTEKISRSAQQQARLKTIDHFCMPVTHQYENICVDRSEFSRLEENAGTKITNAQQMVLLHVVHWEIVQNAVLAKKVTAKLVILSLLVTLDASL